MKKAKPHWEDLPSDEMYELISDVAKILCWYLFFEKGMPREKDDPRDLGWDWARNNALHQPDRFYDLFITCAMDAPIPLKNCGRVIDLFKASHLDIGNIRTAVEMALEWFDCEIREEPVMDKNEGILDMVKVKQK